MTEKKKVNSKSLANLKPFNQMSKEDAAIIQAKGAAVTNAMKKRDRKLKEIITRLLAEPLPKEFTNKLIKTTVDSVLPDATIGEAIIIQQMYLAVAYGSTKAATFLRDTAGQKPVDELVTTLDNPITIVTTDVFDEEYDADDNN